MSSSNNDTKILSEQYSSIYKEGTGSGSAESRYDEPYRKAERAKFDDPGHRQLQQRMQAEYDKKKAEQGEDNDPWRETEGEKQTREHYTPEQSLKEIQEIFEHDDAAAFTDEQLAGAMKNLAEGPTVQAALYHAVSYLNDAMEFNQSKPEPEPAQRYRIGPSNLIDRGL
jgi:hypothetical protein